MPGLNLKTTGVDAFLALRSQVAGQLASRSGDLQKQQLARLQGTSTVVRRKRKDNGLNGVKVKREYRGARTGETWAGRRLKPLWPSQAPTSSSDDDSSSQRRVRR